MLCGGFQSSNTLNDCTRDCSTEIGFWFRILNQQVVFRKRRLDATGQSGTIKYACTATILAELSQVSTIGFSVRLTWKSWMQEPRTLEPHATDKNRLTGPIGSLVKRSYLTDHRPHVFFYSAESLSLQDST